MFISLTLFRIQMSFLRLHIHISSSFFWIFINIIFLKYLFIYTQVSLQYLRHLVIVIFCSICFYVRYSYKKKLSSIFVVCSQETNGRLSTPSNFVFRCQKNEWQFGYNFHISYFVVKERMVQF